MSYDTPAAYAGRYHKLSIMDAKLGIAASLDIQRYISGWMAEQDQEYYRLLSGLAAKLKLKNPAQVRALTQPFYITGHPDRIAPGEEWYDPSLRRAYAGRGSPDEISDAVRLAVFCGLTKDAKAYGEKWFGIDCNAFVGNWLGISPSTAIFAYGLGYGKKDKLPGASPDVYTTRKRVPLDLITDPQKLECGNVVCTFGEKDSRGIRWRHIALVEDVKLVTGTTYQIWLAEWGQAGNIEKHRTAKASPKLVDITLGKFCAEMPGKDVLAFDGTTYPDKKAAKRIFFDHTSLDDLANRGWHVGGMYGT
ncbi:hypothetical protein C8P66_110117 [Humitalea rosea]|uniref:Uncharacterized protein n=1 Tax=Humitalea rosea TaxID=990373 RepID=A0A2W7IH30_9PROT|nr:hypothetical protein [Humitalea rosea]PZW45919.1 hypothetical protein C8P66_110117 [Humitalea rosea]